MFSALMDRLFKDNPGNEAFAERFIATAHRHGMTAPMTYEADLFRIRVGDGSYFHLFNAHRAYLDAKRGKQQEALDMFVRSLRPARSSAASPSWSRCGCTRSKRRAGRLRAPSSSAGSRRNAWNCLRWIIPSIP